MRDREVSSWRRLSTELGRRAQIAAGLFIATALSVGCHSSEGSDVSASANDSEDAGDSSAPYCSPGGPSAQFRGEMLPSGAMTPGARRSVSVAFDNCSGETWQTDHYRLVPADASSDWGVPFVHSSTDVPPGQRVAFAFDITIPLEPGSYPYSWGVELDDSSVPLEERSPQKQIAVLAPIDCSSPGSPARLLSEIAPSQSMLPGQTFDASLSFGNCSAETWSQASGFHLVSVDGLSTWGTASIALTSDVPPGFAITIPVHVVAPTQTGVYAYRWSIADGSSLIDDADPGLSIEVVPCLGAACVSPGQCPDGSPPWRFVAESAPPSSMQPGQAVVVSETFANCSGQTWHVPDIALGSQFPQDSQTWNTGRVPLPADVPSGSQVTIPFVATAPGKPGQYGFQWEMVTPAAWLQQMSPGEWITVGPPPPGPTFDWSHTRYMYSFFSPTTVTPGQITKLDQLAAAGMNSLTLNFTLDNIDQQIAAIRANPTLSKYHYLASFGTSPIYPCAPNVDCRPLTDWIDAVVKVELENQDILSGYYASDEPGSTWNNCALPGAYLTWMHDYIRSRDPDALHRPVANANTMLFWQQYSCGQSFFSTGQQDIIFIDQYNQNNMVVEDYANQVGAFQGWQTYGFPLNRVVFILPSYLPSSAGCTNMDLVGFASNLNQAAHSVYGGGWNGLVGYGYFAFDGSVLGPTVAYDIQDCGPLYDATVKQCSQ